MVMNIQQYVATVEPSVKLAERIGVTPGFISQLVSGHRQVPVERCTAIEQATGGKVTRRDLRPDDWWLIWPELVTKTFPAPQGPKVA